MPKTLDAKEMKYVLCPETKKQTLRKIALCMMS